MAFCFSNQIQVFGGSGSGFQTEFLMESEKSWEISLLSVFLCFTWFSFVFLDCVSNLIVNLLILNRYEKGNLEIHSADAGINSDGDSNDARGDELYVRQRPARNVRAFFLSLICHLSICQNMGWGVFIYRCRMLFTHAESWQITCNVLIISM